MQQQRHESNRTTDRKPACGSIVAYFHGRWVEPPGGRPDGREGARTGRQTGNDAINRARVLTVADVPRLVFEQLRRNVTGEPIPWQTITETIERKQTTEAKDGDGTQVWVNGQRQQDGHV